MNRVVITGIGLITPIGIGKEEFWKNSKQGKSGVKRLEQFEKYNFKSKVFGYVDDFK